MNKPFLKCSSLVALSVVFSWAAICQTPPAQNPKESFLAVGGEVAHRLKLTATDIAKLPRSSVKVKEHDGKEATFEGVALIEILKIAGV